MKAFELKNDYLSVDPCILTEVIKKEFFRGSSKQQQDRFDDWKHRVDNNPKIHAKKGDILFRSKLYKTDNDEYCLYPANIEINEHFFPRLTNNLMLSDAFIKRDRIFNLDDWKKYLWHNVFNKKPDHYVPADFVGSYELDLKEVEVDAVPFEYLHVLPIIQKQIDLNQVEIDKYTTAKNNWVTWLEQF